MDVKKVFKKGAEHGTKKIVSIMVLIFFVIIIALAFLGIIFLIDFAKKGNDSSTLALVSYKLEDASELTTKKLEYRGLIKYDDGDIPIINRGKFSMIYNAKVRAGIDFSKMNISISKDKVLIKIPKAKIQSIDIDTSSLEFYDEQFAIFNLDQKVDLKNALEKARNELKDNKLLSELVEEADKSAQTLIKKLIESSVGNREIVIETEEDNG